MGARRDGCAQSVCMCRVVPMKSGLARESGESFDMRQRRAYISSSRPASRYSLRAGQCLRRWKRQWPTLPQVKLPSNA